MATADVLTTRWATYSCLSFSLLMQELLEENSGKQGEMQEWTDRRTRSSPNSPSSSSSSPLNDDIQCRVLSLFSFLLLARLAHRSRVTQRQATNVITERTDTIDEQPAQKPDATSAKEKHHQISRLLLHLRRRFRQPQMQTISYFLSLIDKRHHSNLVIV